MGDQFESQTLPHQVQLKTTDVAPPTALYIERDDQLTAIVWNSLTGASVVVTARLLLPNGDIVINQWTISPPGDRVGRPSTFDLAEGFLLSVVAVANASGMRRGTTYVRLVINRGGVAVLNGELLAQGYVTSTTDAVAWPWGNNESSVSGRGTVRRINVADPAAGANYSNEAQVPLNAHWRLLGFRFVFTTSAAVANRVVIVRVTDNVDFAYEASAAVGQAASLVQTYQALPGSHALNTTVNFLYLPFPIWPELQPFWTIITAITNIQAADQLSGGRLWVEEFIQE